MGLFGWIVRGAGWEIGSQAVKEGIGALKDTSKRPTEAELKAQKKQAQAAEKRLARKERANERARAKEKKARAAEAKRAEREVEEELARLNKQR